MRAPLPLVAALVVALAACAPPREIDGTNNNPFFPELGAAGTPLARLADAEYWDDVSSMAGQDRPSPRWVSNRVHAQSGSFPNARKVSDYIWQWGQFLDHDIDLTPGANDPSEPQPIPIPPGDPYFLGPMAFNRSIYDPLSGTGVSNPRQQLNLITSYIDASNVYGSDAERAEALREPGDSGRLRTSPGNLLPFNTFGLPNANDLGAAPETLFVAGDLRANEQVALTAMHTLFMREHNRLADLIRRKLPDWSGEEVYQAARRIVGAQIQVITYKEYLPELLGPYAPGVHSVYDPDVDPRITNEFSAALFRLGHSQLSPTLLRLDRRGKEIPAGHLALRHAFFNPDEIRDHGIAPLLRGLARQTAQAVDVRVIDDVRNFLFGAPPADGFDLAALNIQRGRDHGLPSYNGMCAAMGLAVASDYSDISSDPEVQQRLAEGYGPGNVDDVDLWTGALAEDTLPGALVGELIKEVLVRQFVGLRDGDRYWYRRDLHPTFVAAVEKTKLSDIIRRNTEIGKELRPNVFLAGKRSR